MPPDQNQANQREQCPGKRIGWYVPEVVERACIQIRLAREMEKFVKQILHGHGSKPAATRNEPGNDGDKPQHNAQIHPEICEKARSPMAPDQVGQQRQYGWNDHEPFDEKSETNRGTAQQRPVRMAIALSL